MKNVVRMNSAHPSESAMIPVIKEYKNDIFLNGTPEVEVEVSSGYGIADVVFFSLNNQRTLQRLR